MSAADGTETIVRALMGKPMAQAVDILDSVFLALAVREREACAQVCADIERNGGFADPETRDALTEAAERIRARTVIL